jgi:hypothetical protein
MRGTRRGLEVGTLLLVVGTIMATGTLRGQMSDELKWGPAPPALPAGASLAVLAGDPGKAGELFIIRLKAPDGYHVPPHTHPGDEHLTVIKGTFMVGMGEKWDDKAMKRFTAGGHTMAPKEMAHFAATKGETIVEVSGIGPFAIKYVNPNDDPSVKKTATAGGK